MLLHRAVAVSIIPVERHVAVVGYGTQAVLAVPRHLALCHVWGGAVIVPFSCHRLVCQVAVGVVGVSRPNYEFQHN